MNKLKSKLKSKKGFTLIEMLIVVAIIAILVAIAAPVISSSLDDARKSTDSANLRAAQSAALADYISKDKTGSVTYYYTEDGEVVNDKASAMTGQSSTHKNECIQITVNEGKAVAEWVSKSGS